ncbi:hypothetical protein NUU61_003190 [Penicillium alfredii]|uniref:gluconokinase n=1 Tax=Penicillium alfredii TaxID=1506179 RepID=A0A9W9FT32_9EURO|nr:uncharacterized protein NUU61_003190 [Penicillium alfredii]KAJ5105843.1 hypothetical protein NUU61_003190 [Penicillium alfredii]
MEIHKRNAWISQAPLWLDRPLILSIAVSTESTNDRSIYLAAIKMVHGLLEQVNHSQAEFNLWLQRLRDPNQDPTANPPIKLLDFFASKYDNTDPSRALLYDTKKAQASPPSLAQAGGLNADLTARFVKNFSTQCWAQQTAPTQSPREVFFLIGPCSCGKSIAAQTLAQRLQIPTIEGDDLHSPIALAKMANNLPLQDSDRWNWLAHIRGAAHYLPR